MGYVPGFKHDIFLSYPRENNLKDPQGLRWVTEFHRCLQMALNLLVPVQEKPKIYFDDHDFETGQTSNNDLLESARRSALFLAVVSPAYIAPDKFTLKELHAFCSTRPSRPADAAPILSIDFLPIDESSRPIQLKTTRRTYFFWTNDNNAEVPVAANHPDFMPKIYTVAKQIKKRLDEVKIASGNVTARTNQQQTPYSGITVLLGQVTDDLVDIRDELRDYIEKLGPTVLPGSEYVEWGPEFVNQFDPMLASCDLFIQLLSKVRSSRGRQDEEPASCAQFQHDAAVAASKRVMLWRDLSDISKVNHYDKALLESAQAMGLEQFKSAVKAELDQLIEQEVDIVFPRTGDAFIYITASTEDLKCAIELKRIASTCGTARIMEEEEKLKDFKKQIRRAEAVVFLYGDAPRRFVDLWLDKYSQEKLKLKNPPRIEAVYYAPPPKNSEQYQLRIGWKGLREFGSEEIFRPADILKIFAELNRGIVR